ncbi:MAG: hypothetical protein KKD01_13970 [Proteobacteria bacterium]|nr:hypothetical protein [Pseudomonadota bacterium]MBU1234417.1 hypothetical protein [Pseudomonadota bacterium]MBU1418635.1 hypothetical protein [Pseudomonadota bacterium]MBU1455828.1 hypothetical protein [Pseudomonadota bacterium]
MKKLLVFFAAGCVGALANSLTVWLAGDLGIASSFGVAIAPSLTANYLYPRIVWGGLWALLFILPMLQSKLLLKGTVLSLFPTAVQLFVVFPLQAHKGMAGMELGLYTPLFVIFYNWIWGIVTALTIKFAR